MRIAIVYDCLFPHTVGGAERWCRALAERLQGEHRVTYVTRRQWDDEGPGTPFAVTAVAPGGPLYARSGRRRIGPPIRFGLGVFAHMLRHGRDYDVVHTASFPYFSLIGAWLALRLVRSKAKLVVDWHEVWSAAYWRDYLGPVGGPIGHAVQRLCARLPDLSFTFSRLHGDRLAGEGHRAPLTVLRGEYDGHADSMRPPEPLSEVEPVVVFAGRHIPEKRVPAIPPAIAAARERVPALRCVILGDGPDIERTRELVAELGLEGAVELRGRVASEEVIAELRRSACMLLPSAREGYGMIVVEALAVDTPAVVVAGPDNAATELIEPDVNGIVADSADPEVLADAIARIVEAGPALRGSVREWFDDHRDELAIETSLRRVGAAYEAEER